MRIKFCIFFCMYLIIISCDSKKEIKVNDCECLEIFMDEPLYGIKDYDSRKKCLDKWIYEIDKKHYKSNNLGVYNDPAQFYDEICGKKNKTEKNLDNFKTTINDNDSKRNSLNEISNSKYSYSKEKTLTGYYIDYEEGDLVHYYFKDESGTEFDFSEIPNKFNLTDGNGQLNKDYLNKKFKIKWKKLTPLANGEYDYEFNKIISIELLN